VATVVHFVNNPTGLDRLDAERLSYVFPNTLESRFAPIGVGACHFMALALGSPRPKIGHRTFFKWAS
jgi:hypothetical protein